MKLFIKYSPIIIVLVTLIIALLTIKGDKGFPIYFQDERDARLGGPFEATNSTSRYSLIETIVEKGTFFFNDEEAKFSAPDITYHNGRYFSIFTPGVSFIAIPFYFLGKFLGAQQLTTYLLNIVALLVNIFLIIKLANQLGVKKNISIIGGVIFALSTNSLAYALTLTQHQLSTTLILFAVINSLNKDRTFIKNMMLGLILGVGVLVDIPIVFALIPCSFYALSNSLKFKSIEKGKLSISIRSSIFAILLGIIPFMIIFGWYNYNLTGSFFKMGQTLGRSDFPHKEDNTLSEKEIPSGDEVNSPFSTRNQMRNFYLLLISEERGLLYFSPIVLFGLLGLLISYKDKNNHDKAVLIGSTILAIVVMYSMHGDPWGGWAFGSRYMIPVSALLLANFGVAFKRFYKNPIFIGAFLILLGYSTIIGFVGALTTNLVPPKVEAVNLTTPIPYTYEYNFDLLNKNESSALVYNLLLKDKVPYNYYFYGLVAATILIVSFAYVIPLIENRKEKDK